MDHRPSRGVKSRKPRPPIRKVKRKPLPPAKKVAAAPPKPFTVMIAVSRPRYRARAERACAYVGWDLQVLTNKVDPIGLINKDAPDIYIVQDDFGGSKKMGMITAAHRFRSKGLQIIGIFEDEELAELAGEYCDAVMTPPWKALQLRDKVVAMYKGRRVGPLVLIHPPAAGTVEEDS